MRFEEVRASRPRGFPGSGLFEGKVGVLEAQMEVVAADSQQHEMGHGGVEVDNSGEMMAAEGMVVL